MANTNTPIRAASPEDRQNLPAAMRAWFRNMQLRDDNLLPAIVQSYDSTQNLATVKPLIQVVDVNDNPISRFPLAQIPCLALGAGNAGGGQNGFVLHFPIVQGDFGWIFAADRDLTLFKQQLAECVPQTGRIHQFGDGMFIPDIFRRYTLASGDTGRMVMQTTDGTVKITIGADGVIELTAPTKVHMTAPLVEMTQDLLVHGNMTINGTSHQVGAVTMDATLSVAGNVTFNTASTPSTMIGGVLTAPNAIIAGKSVNGHVHTDPQGGSTGPF